jgi:adenine-specific DNA-methyltransferase
MREIAGSAHGTKHHAAWWALQLNASEATGTVSDIARSIANAKVDLNPHQVDAALFAMRSPLSRGVILADEVGLGKTIEAGLIIAQRWAERRRRILLIVPATLRKQWVEELRQKFGLPAEILDQRSQSVDRTDAILVMSYQFAAGCATSVADIPWDLVVFDEAHRLRNVYKSGSRIAVALRDATENAPKLLLTATPLQNSLLELYGLASFVDPHCFGDEASFRARYGSGSALDAPAAAHLRERMSGVLTRTLRAQVLEFVRFTNRIPLTQDFTPSVAEQELYDLVSAYLQRTNLVAIPPGQRALMTLVLRRLLASSSYAIAGTLRRLATSLEAVIGSALEVDATALNSALTDDFDGLEELADELTHTANRDADQSAPDPASELAELRRYAALAESIERNAKGVALLAALETALGRATALGAARKAVVFTESRRTQEYLVRLLEANGYAGQVVFLNGQNNDPISRARYEAWREAHSGTGTLSGSRSADTRAAIIDAFRTSAAILVATEAAAEGVNLQFCSLVVNYDLPWNPQRIEQRIGRCHRYGQQHDVVVLNLVNTANAADRRVHDLLSAKFRLFEGVFGASDGVLGALESGVDIERRIGLVYQSCRTTDEIHAAFDELQAELETEIADRMERTRRAVLEHFDDDVQTRLHVHREQAQQALEAHQRALWSLAQHELAGQADFAVDMPRFRYYGDLAPHGWYALHWPDAERRGDTFFRPDHPLAAALIDRALLRELPAADFTFQLSQRQPPVAALAEFIGASGWLVCGQLTVQSLQTERHPVLAAVSTDGRVLDAEQAGRLLTLDLLQHVPTSLVDVSPALSVAMHGAFQRILADVERRNAGWYDEEVTKLDAWADDLRLSLERELKELDRQIVEARGQARGADTLTAKLEAQRLLKSLEQRRNNARRELFAAQDRIAERRDELIEAVERQLAVQSTWSERFTIRWRLV